MLLPSGFKSLSEYFEEAIVFLQKYSWLYEAPVTHLLTCEILARIPEDWISHLLELSNDELNNLPKGLIKDDFPPSVAEFSRDCQRFTLPILASDEPLYKPYGADNWITSVPREVWRGMSPKKKEEVEIMSAFVHHECELLGINKVLDLGSGLGYIDRLLLLRGYKILGIESQVKLVTFATIQKDNFFPPTIAKHLSYHNIKILGNMSSDVRSAILSELFSTDIGKVKSAGRKTNENANKYDWEKLTTLFKNISDNTSSGKVCMIGLHACGDLAVTGMELYLNIPEVSALVMVPCCYHKMALKNTNSSKLDIDVVQDDDVCDADIESSNDECFYNFPVSETLRRLSFGAKFLCRPFLRLASQGTNNSWLDWTEANHHRHAYNVLSRAVIQLFAEKEGANFKKCFRRVVKKTSMRAEDFSTYVDETLNRCEFINQSQSTHFTQKSKEDIRKNLLDMWEQHKNKLRLIEVLTGLQMCLEPVAESLVVADRVAFLQENGAHDIKLVRMMDSRLSPRSLAYIVSKS